MNLPPALKGVIPATVSSTPVVNAAVWIFFYAYVGVMILVLLFCLPFTRGWMESLQRRRR